MIFHNGRASGLVNDAARSTAAQKELRAEWEALTAVPYDGDAGQHTNCMNFKMKTAE